MTRTERFRSPEEVQRLEDLKRGVNLIALATERYGLAITEKPGSAEGHTKLQNKGTGEVLLIKKSREGWDVYTNVSDDRDKGSVVDFLQNRHPGLNIGQAKGMLAEMVPGARQALDMDKYNAQLVQRLPSAAETRYEALPPEERRAAMVRETTGPKPVLTDASYLLERGLSTGTIADPAFAGRVFTDQHPERQQNRNGEPQHNVGFPYYNDKGIQSWELRNRGAEEGQETFKMMMKAPGDQFGAKNGVWSSNLLEGKGSQPERLVLGESPIDMMSKYQTERAAQGDELPNTRYVATGGTPSKDQKAIIQNLIDREQPRQVVLANDNDAGGQAFNARYLNDLRPPLAGLSPEQQEQAEAARQRVQWMANDNGKGGEEKLVAMTVTFQHERAREGRNAGEHLRDLVEQRGLNPDEPTTPNGRGVQQRRNGATETELVVRVAPAEAGALVDLAVTLRQEREAALPEAARTPENYFVVEKANGKDYNQDILQARAEEQLAAARERIGFTAEAGPRENAPALELPVAAPTTIEQAYQRMLTGEAQRNSDSVEATQRYAEKALQFSPGQALTVTAGYQAEALIEGNVSAREIRAFETVGATVSKMGETADLQVRYPLDQPDVAARVSTLLDRLEGNAKEYTDGTGAGGGVASVEVMDATREEAQTRRELARTWEATNDGPDLATRMESVVRTGSETGMLLMATVFVPENEPLPAGVVAADAQRFRTPYQDQLTEALRATGTAVESRHLVDQEGPQTELTFRYETGSERETAISTLLSAAVHAGGQTTRDEPGGLAWQGIEVPDLRGAAPPMPRPYAVDELPVALVPTGGADELLVARLEAIGLPVTEAQANGQPAYLVFLGRGEQKSAAFEELLAVQADENRPVTVLESDRTQDRRNEEARGYYVHDNGEQRDVAPPAILSSLPSAEVAQERLPGDSGPAQQVAQERFAPEQVASNQFTPEQFSPDRFAPERFATPQIVADIDLNGSTSAAEIIRADANKDGVVTDTELQQARFEIKAAAEAEVAKAAIGYPGVQDYYLDRLVKAGATLIEQPVSELAPAGTQSISYPLDRTDVVVRVSEVLDEIEKNARSGSRNPEGGPHGVYELPEARENRQTAYVGRGESLEEEIRRENRAGAQAAEADSQRATGEKQPQPVTMGEAYVVDPRNTGVGRTLENMGLSVTRENITGEQTDIPRGTLLVRYPLDQPDVVAKVSILLDQHERRSDELARALREQPNLEIGGIMESATAREARQRITEQYAGRDGQVTEAAPQRALPGAVEPQDRPVERPTYRNEQTSEAAPAVVAPASEQPAAERPAPAAVLAQDPPAHPIERRVTLDVRDGDGFTAAMLEKALIKSSFEVAKAPLEATGEERAGTRLQVLYRTTDPGQDRERQVAELTRIQDSTLQKQGVLTVHESAEQAAERAASVRAPGQPAKSQLVEAGQNLRAQVVMTDAVPSENRALKVFDELKANGARVGFIAETDRGEAGISRTFPVQYSPTEARLPRVSAVLEAAARADGGQVTETDNNRVERLARAAAKEAKQDAERTPEQRAAYVRPSPDYPAPNPNAWVQVALTSEALAAPGAVKALREEFKATGAEVAVQPLDRQLPGGTTVTVGFLAAHPQRAEVEEVLQAFAGRGGHVYDLKAGADFSASREAAAPAVAQETAAVVAAVPAIADAREANAEDLRALETRRDLLLAEQREHQARSAQAEQQLQPTVGVEVKPWVGFGPDLRGQDMRDTDAAGMDLRGANLQGLDLRTTDLQNSDLREANLQAVNLTNVNLTGVRLEGAALEGAILDKAYRVVENEEGRRNVQYDVTAEQLLQGPGVPVAAEAVKTPEVAAEVAAPNTVPGPGEATREQEGVSSPATAEASPTVDGRAPAAVVEAAPVFSLPTEAELVAQSLPVGPPAQVLAEPAVVAEPVAVAVEGPAAEPSSQAGPVQVPYGFGPVEREVTAPEVVAAGVSLAPAAGEGGLSPYERAEELGTALHVVTVRVTQPIWSEEGGIPYDQTPDRVAETLAQLRQTGAEVIEEKGSTLDAVKNTETNVLTLAYAHDDKNLPDLHHTLEVLAQQPAGSDFAVVVEDPNAAARAVAVEARLENTPAAAQALASELHPNDAATGRLLIERPALEDVWALEDAGAKVSRVYLPDGPAAQVSYPLNEPGITGPVSIELDRIDRDSQLSRAPHNSVDREISGPLLGEDPAQQQQRQAQAVAEGLTLAPAPRYELYELAQADARSAGYYREEAHQPTDPLRGTLNGQAWQGSPADVEKLPADQQQALVQGWAKETTTVEIVVREAPALDVPGAQQGEPYPERVAAALRTAGAQVEADPWGISPDTGLDKTVVRATFANDSPELARIQATLDRLADQPGVAVSPEGAWQRDRVLGPEGRLVEPVVAERERPWLEATAIVVTPTPEERRQLLRAGAQVEETELVPNQQAVLVRYDLDNPRTVALVSEPLEHARQDNRLVGESLELGEARQGRAEQHQKDVRVEQEQTANAWDAHSKQYPQREAEPARQASVVADESASLPFTQRLRAAVKEKLAEYGAAWEATSPEQIAIRAAEQRGIADRLGTSQAAQERAAYARGFAGPAEVPGVVSGTVGTETEVRTDQVLRDRRDDERTRPVVMDAPAESKVQDTQEVVKPGIAARPDVALAPEGPAAPSAPTAAAAAQVAAVQVPYGFGPVGIPAVGAVEANAARAITSGPEWQHGVISMAAGERGSGEDRLNVVRERLLGAGASVQNVQPVPGVEGAALLNYSYQPQMAELGKLNDVLQRVETSVGARIREEPHPLHQPETPAHNHAVVPAQQWPEREGQYAQAHIVVDDANHRGRERAQRIGDELKHEGAAVSAVKSDGHGHMEIDVSYHTHTPQIEKINNTLDKAGNSAGIEVRETDQNRDARYQGAEDLAQSRSRGPEQERE